jgi:PAS domain S-box-containing protein
MIWSISVVRDITEIKKAEKALLESEKRFRRLVNQMPIPLCYVNKDGALLYFNYRFVETFGYTHEDVPTLEEWGQLAFPEENYRRWIFATWETTVQRAIQEKTDIQPIEYNVTCKEGMVRIVEISGIIIGDGPVIATFIDLTDRKRAEEIFRESEASRRVGEAIEAERWRLFDILEKLPAMICLLTYDYRIAFANRSYREHFSVSRGCIVMNLVLDSPINVSSVNPIKYLKPENPIIGNPTVRMEE